MINNDVKNWQGKLVGFRCTNCGDIYDSGWGNTCNKCRTEERRHKELIEAMKSKEKSNA